jgi:hypothetical protein
MLYTAFSCAIETSLNEQTNTLQLAAQTVADQNRSQRILHDFHLSYADCSRISSRLMTLAYWLHRHNMHRKQHIGVTRMLSHLNKLSSPKKNGQHSEQVSSERLADAIVALNETVWRGERNNSFATWCKLFMQHVRSSRPARHPFRLVASSRRLRSLFVKHLWQRDLQECTAISFLLSSSLQRT